MTMDQAAAIAGKTVPDGRLVSVTRARRRTTKSTYFAYLARGNDPYDHGVYPGNVGVTIDRYSGKATITYPTQANPPLSARSSTTGSTPMHAATFVNGWWRVHLARARRSTPVVLAVTGIITWLIRRGKRKRKLKRRRAAPPRHERVAHGHGRALRRRARAVLARHRRARARPRARARRGRRRPRGSAPRSTR